MARHADDLERLCRERKIGEAVFVGVSIGGYVLQEFWQVGRSRVRGLVLCDTRANADSEEGKAARFKSIDDVRERGPEAFIKAQSERLIGESTRRNRPDIVEAALETMRWSSIEGIASTQQGMAQRPDYTSILSTIDVPTVLVFGEEDVVTPPDVGRAMQQKIPKSELHVLPQAGHFAAFEKPRDFVRLLRRFLDPLK
jgi:3-oxoadipate enol-lactonase